MPANQRQQTAKSKAPAQVPISPTSKATAKYTNKDGSKFITVPKAESTEIRVTSMTSPTATVQNGQLSTAPATINGTNKKKQKRREKLAAKRAAEQGGQGLSTGTPPSQDAQRTESDSRHMSNGQIDNGQFESPEGDPYDTDEEGDVYSGSYGSPPNGHSNPQPSNPAGNSISRRKKKSKSNRSHSSENTQSGTNGAYHSHAHSHGHSQNHSGPLLSSLQTSMPRGPGISKEKIWNTSSHEERERIKEFWLSLEEGERKSLVKVEKDAVLKKMKEQQRHSCSCTVCGRKRTAIEEELEVLYDAYYEELEQYANHHDGVAGPMMPPPRRFGAMSGLQPPNRLPSSFSSQQASQSRIEDPPLEDEDEEGDEDYSDEALDEDYDESEPEEIPPRSYQTDFFNFGASLTVQGGILTVADDLLKNDGKKFIEMMEQLAERRMAREEDARDQQNYYGHPPNGMHNHNHAHNHPPPPVEEEEYDDDEEDEDYDSADEEYDDDDEELDTMTEEQRMEEGRRMFQIFAARMFEQRVLTAYREKVAKERQQKLIEEDEEERKRDSLKKAKKAKDAQKKKDKLQQRKQLLAEEKAKKEAEEAEKAAAKAAAEEKVREDQRIKDEEKRRKREAAKAAQDAERLKQVQEKQRAKERQMEEERKKREAKEKRDEQKREEKERKEREASERQSKLEREKREKEAKEKAEKDAKDRQQRDDLAAQQSAAKAAAAAAQALKRPPVPIPVNLQPQHPVIASPHIPVATPVVPKAPTPGRLRTASQHESSGPSIPQTPRTGGVSQNVSPVPSTPLQGSPGPIGPPGKSQNQPFLHHPQASSPIHSALKTPPGIHTNHFSAPQALNMGFQQSIPPTMIPPGYNHGRLPFEAAFHPQMGGPFRPGPNPPMPPGMNLHQMQQGRGFPMPAAPPGFPQSPNGFGGIGQSFAAQKGPLPTQPRVSHSRQSSIQDSSIGMGIYEPTSQAQPIARPAPIGRPSSVVHGQRHGDHGKNEVDDLSDALGSSALIDDSDEPFNGAGPRRSSGAPIGMGRPFPIPQQGFPGAENAYTTPITPWNSAFASSSLPGSNFTPWPAHLPSTNAFGPLPKTVTRLPANRATAIRFMICRACKNLEGSTPDGFYDVEDIKADMLAWGAHLEPMCTEQEMVDICGTEGNISNGGGYLDVRTGANGRAFISFDARTPHRQSSAGHIGSPIVGGGSRF